MSAEYSVTLVVFSYACLALARLLEWTDDFAHLRGFKDPDAVLERVCELPSGDRPELYVHTSFRDL